MSTVYLVVPCYNEEAVLPETVSRLTEKMKTLIAAGHADENSRFLLVDDGSKDKTWELICRFCEENPLCAGLKLAHNRGASERSARRPDGGEGEGRLRDQPGCGPAGRY